MGGEWVVEQAGEVMGRFDVVQCSCVGDDTHGEVPFVEALVVHLLIKYLLACKLVPVWNAESLCDVILHHFTVWWEYNML